MPSSKSSIDKRDVYYRKGKSDGYRARSAYKLLHLDEEFDLFRGVSTAVDLCAAPGSWSQVLGQKLNPGKSEGSNKIVSIDLQPMAPLPNITILETDITLPSTVPLVLSALDGRKADLVVCDGAPDVTGVHDLDAYLHSQLLLAALTLSLTLLAPHATLIFKIFLSPLDPTAALLRSQLRSFFPSPMGGIEPESFTEIDADAPLCEGEENLSSATASSWAEGYDSFGRRGGVWVRKPRSSRQGSGEAFIVCRNFDPSTIPLPETFSTESLAALRQQVKGTLTLESLSSLGSDINETSAGDWAMVEAFVGGGNLNVHPLSPPLQSPPPESPLLHGLKLSIQTEKNSHQSDTSLGRIDGHPTPTETDSSRFPPSTDSTFLLPGHLQTVGKANKANQFSSETSVPYTQSPMTSVPLLPLPSPELRLGRFAGIERDLDISATTPQGDGAVSPALSSSSKTDMFFASSQRESLPVPPKALPNASFLGRGYPSTIPRNPSRTASTPFSEQRSHPESATTPQTSLRSVTTPQPWSPPIPIRVPTPPREDTIPSRSLHQRRESNFTREVRQSDPAEPVIKAGDVLDSVTDDPNATSKAYSTISRVSWRVTKCLGEGAFSAVWSAESTTEPKLFAAVKLIDRHARALNSGTHISFSREVEILRHIVHPGIVRYISHFSASTHHCLVLERLDGGELFELVSNDQNRERMFLPGPGDLDGDGFVRRVFGELCRAVSWLHEIEVVHRDIKLENIIFTVNPFNLPPTSTGSIALDKLPTPLVKLTDFGLSRFIQSESPLLSTRCGSESFAAPEIVMGNLYDGRATDAWAVGVVLYALVAGELPFDEGAPQPLSRSRANSAATGSGSAAPQQYPPTEREIRKRTMHRIAKAEYHWRDGIGSPDVRRVVASFLVRDPTRRARVADLWLDEWISQGAGAVPPPHRPLISTIPQAPADQWVQGRYVEIQQGVLLDGDNIDNMKLREEA